VRWSNYQARIARSGSGGWRFSDGPRIGRREDGAVHGT
jgi:hypothetical protein